MSTLVYLCLGILMHNIIKNRPDIINEILRKLPEGTDPDFVERDEYIFIMCEKLGMFFFVYESFIFEKHNFAH